MNTRIGFAMALMVACGGDTTTGPGDGGGDDGPSNKDGTVGTDTGATDSATDTGTTDDATADASAETGVDAGTFDPKSVTNLVLWLDGSKDVTINSDGGTGKVSAWKDQTSNGNNAAQSIVARQPTQAVASVNGKDCLKFTQGSAPPGNMMLITDSTSLQWGTGDYWFAVVAKYDNAATNGTAYTTGVGTFYSKLSSSINGISLCGNYPAGANVTAGLMMGFSATASMTFGGTYNDNTARLYVGQRIGTTLYLRLNGTQIAIQTQSPALDTNGTGGAVHIGAQGDATIQRLNGEICEVMAVKGTLSTTDQTSLEGYLKSRYGL